MEVWLQLILSPPLLLCRYLFRSANNSHNLLVRGRGAHAVSGWLRLLEDQLLVAGGRRCSELGVGPRTKMQRAARPATTGLPGPWGVAGLPLGMLVGIAIALKGQQANVAPGGRQIGPVRNRTRFRGPTVCLQSEMQLWLLLPAVVHGEIQAEALPFVPPLGQRAQVGLVQPWSCGAPRPSVHHRRPH